MIHSDTLVVVKVRVSVLLPAHNAAATLPACLESLGRQTLGAWECVLVDDGSTDRTPHVAADFASREPRLRMIRSEHVGLVGALQQGLAECSGTLVARMDADDVMHRRRLEHQVLALERDPDLAAVGCHVRMFPRSGIGDGMRDYERWIRSIHSETDVRREAFVECPVVHPTLVARREWLLKLGYRDRDWPEDYDLVLRMLAADLRVGMVPRRLLAWRHHPGRHQRVHPRYRLAGFRALKARFLATGFLAAHETYLLWGYGTTGRRMCQALAAHGRHPVYILELHPGRLGNRIHGAQVVSPDKLPLLPRLPLLVSVAGAGPRNQIRDQLTALGWVEQRDYVCVA